MNSIDASKFREQCLALLDELDDDGLVVTKRASRSLASFPTSRAKPT